MIQRAVLASVIATIVYAGFMWLLDDFKWNALGLFFVIVLVFNLVWHGYKARKAKKEDGETK